MAKSKLTLLERLMSKVEMVTESGCWIWMAGSLRGYGQISVGGRHGSMKGAHRIAYELLKGPIPKGLELDHLCRVTFCINPAHLEPVTHQVNAQRGEAGKYEKVRTHCPQGHPYNQENTQLHRGWHRLCKACHLVHARKSGMKIRAQRRIKAFQGGPPSES